MVRGSLWAVGMRWSIRFIGLLSTVILARLLMPEDFGIFAMAGLVIGFLDLFTPALLAANLESELTRFVAAGMAVSQIIYMSDLGVLVLRSGLPLNLLRLFWIFSLRTIIIYPIFLVAGHLIL